MYKRCEQEPLQKSFYREITFFLHRTHVNPRLRNRRNKNEFHSGLQSSEQGPDVDTPPLRDGAEIIRAFSPFGQWLMVMRGTRRIIYPANNH